MVWLNHSPIPVGRRGVISSVKWFLPAFPRVEGEVGTLWFFPFIFIPVEWYLFSPPPHPPIPSWQDTVEGTYTATTYPMFLSDSLGGGGGGDKERKIVFRTRTHFSMEHGTCMQWSTNHTNLWEKIIHKNSLFIPQHIPYMYIVQCPYGFASDWLHNGKEKWTQRNWFEDFPILYIIVFFFLENTNKRLRVFNVYRNKASLGIMIKIKIISSLFYNWYLNLPPYVRNIYTNGKYLILKYKFYFM